MCACRGMQELTRCMLQAGDCADLVFSAGLTNDSAMNGRAILELDGDSLVGQLHEEPDELHPCSCRSPLRHEEFASPENLMLLFSNFVLSKQPSSSEGSGGNNCSALAVLTQRHTLTHKDLLSSRLANASKRFMQRRVFLWQLQK
jgi:hypothetical protein